MSNKELYKKTFSQIHASEDKIMEVIKMTDTKKRNNIRKFIAIAVCAASIMSVGIVANAATDGEIGKSIISWFSADGTEQKVEGTVSYDENGKKITEYQKDGKNVKITEDEKNDCIQIEGDAEGAMIYEIGDEAVADENDKVYHYKDIVIFDDANQMNK